MDQSASDAGFSGSHFLFNGERHEPDVTDKK
jgi:hypothetical protein